MKRKNLFLIVLILFCSISAFSQARKIYVEVSVQVKDTKLRDTIESYITRELRTLGDVEVDSPGFFKIEVLALENRTSTELLGYTMSVVISHFSTCTSRKTNSKGKLETWTCYVQKFHFLRVGSTDDFRKMCEDVVTDFDTRALKPMRAVK